MPKKLKHVIHKKEAKSIVLDALGFYQFDRNAPVSKTALKKMMQRLHVVQLDALKIVERTQYFPAFSRLGTYEQALHDHLAYKEKAWMETWAHEASLIPVAHEPLFRWSKQRAREGHTWQSLHRFSLQEKYFVQDVYQELKERGPMQAKDFQDTRRMKKKDVWGAKSYNTMALDWLFRIGQVGVCRKDNFAKVYDCIENIVPQTILQQATPNPNEAIKQLLLLSVKALGLGTVSCIIDYFRLPVNLAKPILQEMIEAQDIVAYNVEAWPASVYGLPKQKKIQHKDIAALISPFDPLIWHRKRCFDLFDFDYKIEIYVPKEKRRWGYYVYPFFLNDQFVGRVDLKVDQKNKALNVHASHAEPKVNQALVAEYLFEELTRLKQWLKLETIKIDRLGNLAQALNKQLNSSIKLK